MVVFGEGGERGCSHPCHFRVSTLEHVELGFLGLPTLGHLPVWCMCVSCLPVLNHPLSILVRFKLTERGRESHARPMPVQSMSL